jgi:hypothetical protein
MKCPANRILIEQRRVTRVEAAAYCGLIPEGFDEWVKQGIVPCPIPRAQRWDRKAIDVALDRASGLQSPAGEDDAFERWRANHADLTGSFWAGLTERVDPNQRGP